MAEEAKQEKPVKKDLITGILCRPGQEPEYIAIDDDIMLFAKSCGATNQQATELGAYGDVVAYALIDMSEGVSSKPINTRPKQRVLGKKYKGTYLILAHKNGKWVELPFEALIKLYEELSLPQPEPEVRPAKSAEATR